MQHSVVNNDRTTTANCSSLIGGIVREGARRMLAAALEAEAYIAELGYQRDEAGQRLVVRNGYHQPRKGHHRGRPVGGDVTRLTAQWQVDHAAFMDRDLAEVDCVYVWADGIHLNVRLEKAKTCVLVLVGVRADGSKELVALKDGYRGSAESCGPI